jgi:hypothetical protein
VAADIAVVHEGAAVHEGVCLDADAVSERGVVDDTAGKN